VQEWSVLAQIFITATDVLAWWDTSEEGPAGTQNCYHHREECLGYGWNDEGNTRRLDEAFATVRRMRKLPLSPNSGTPLDTNPPQLQASESTINTTITTDDFYTTSAKQAPAAAAAAAASSNARMSLILVDQSPAAIQPPPPHQQGVASPFHCIYIGLHLRHTSPSTTTLLSILEGAHTLLAGNHHSS